MGPGSDGGFDWNGLGDAVSGVIGQGIVTLGQAGIADGLQAAGFQPGYSQQGVYPYNYGPGGLTSGQPAGGGGLGIILIIVMIVMAVKK